MKITTEMIRGYLTSVGHIVHSTEELTHTELGLFCNEVSHKTGADYSLVARAMDNIDLLPAHVLSHIEAATSVQIERPVVQQVTAVTAPVVEAPVVEVPVAAPVVVETPVVEEVPTPEPTPEPAVEPTPEPADSSDEPAQDEQAE